MAGAALAVGDEFSVGLVDEVDAVHADDLGNPVAVFGFDVALPKVFGLVHVRVSVDDLKAFPHSGTPSIMGWMDV